MGRAASFGLTGAPAMACEAAPEFWSDLGERWRLVWDSHYKSYPCSRRAHPSMDAAADLMQAQDVHQSQIAHVKIAPFTMPRASRDTDMPLSDAKISRKFHLFADPVLGRARADEIEYPQYHFR